MHKSSRIRLLPQQLFAGIRLIFDKRPNSFDEVVFFNENKVYL